MQDVGMISCNKDASTSPGAVAEERCVGGCWVGLAEDFSVVDANSSAMVGPRMLVRGPCGCTNTIMPVQTISCTPNTCLNGGRCLSTSLGTRFVHMIMPMGFHDL